MYKKNPKKTGEEKLSRAIQVHKSLIRLVEIWKPLLGLSDWNISVRVVTRKAWKKAKDGSFANGQCHSDMHSQTAELWIIDAEDYIPEYNEQKYSPKYLLLHELLHIPLEYFSGRDFDCSEYYDGKNIMREQFINRMARTLLELSKGDEAADAN